MRVLISAYACQPHRGSEPEAGLRTVIAAAQAHDVWVVTRTNNLEALRSFLVDIGIAERVTAVGIDVPGMAMRWKHRLGPVGLHAYYEVWQKEASSRVQQLHRKVRFDLAHHVTFASYWTRVGVASLDVPLVWGPLGGGVETPPRVTSVLGVRGLGEEMVRFVGRRLLSRLPRARREQSRASVVLVNNPETARRLRHVRTPPRLVPHSTSIELAHVEPEAAQRSRDVLFVGRLVGWKGAALAIGAMRHVSDRASRLIVIGDGAERRRLQRLTARLGLDQNVVFLGSLPRSEVLAKVASAAAVVHPAVHDESPFSVAEALSLGTPVVYVNHGGARVVASRWPNTRSVGIAIQKRGNLERAIAEALDGFLADPPPVVPNPLRPTPSYQEELLDAYRLAVADVR